MQNEIQSFCFVFYVLLILFHFGFFIFISFLLFCCALLFCFYFVFSKFDLFQIVGSVFICINLLVISYVFLFCCRFFICVVILKPDVYWFICLACFLFILLRVPFDWFSFHGSLHFFTHLDLNISTGQILKMINLLSALYVTLYFYSFVTL